MRNLALVEFNLFETGIYRSQFRKPFELNVNSNHSQWYDEATHGGTRTNVEAMNTLAASAIRVAGTPEYVVGNSDGSVEIDGGWEENRARFVITIRDQLTANCCRIYHYIGWTNHLGWIDRGTQETVIDPDMRLYFNQVIEIVENTQMRNGVPYRHARVERSDQFLNGRFAPNREVNGHDRYNDYSIRPCEIVEQLGAASIMNMAYHGQAEEQVIIPTHTSFINKIKHSAGGNARPVGWLSKILTANIGEDENQNYPGNGVNHARTAIRAADTTLNQEPLFVMFQRDMLRDYGFITYGMFKGAFPDIENMVVCHKQDHVGWEGASSAAHSAPFHSSTLEGQAVAVLQATLPSLASECLFRRLYFRFSNDNRTMINNISLVPMEILPGESNRRPSFDGMVSAFDVDLQWGVFCRRLEVEVLPLLTSNNTQIIDVTINFSVTGDMRVVISVNNEPAQEFRPPCFCNTLSSALLTNDASRIVAHSRDLNNLINSHDVVNVMDSISRNAWDDSVRTYDHVAPARNVKDVFNGGDVPLVGSLAEYGLKVNKPLRQVGTDIFDAPMHKSSPLATQQTSAKLGTDWF